MYRFHSDWEQAPRTTPPGTTLLAVADVHGCSAHLAAMRGLLGSVIARAMEQSRRCELVMIGDYVDRGPDSLGVLRQLGRLGQDLEVPVHLLRGNHDQYLIEAMRVMPHHDVLESWSFNGGDTTLAECGIGPDELFDPDPAEISARLRQRLRPELVALLKGTLPCWRAGDYLFVHGGVHPTHPLEAHSLDDLVWLREPFLDGRGWMHPFAVVHGHTPEGPKVLPHRVGTDGGCFFTGVLTAVELADDRLRFHLVSVDPELRRFRESFISSQDRLWRPVAASW
jgi:serine/threonine protein phosphatase 1